MMSQASCRRYQSRHGITLLPVATLPSAVAAPVAPPSALPALLPIVAAASAPEEAPAARRTTTWPRSSSTRSTLYAPPQYMFRHPPPEHTTSSSIGLRPVAGLPSLAFSNLAGTPDCSQRRRMVSASWSASAATTGHVSPSPGPMSRIERISRACGVGSSGRASA